MRYSALLVLDDHDIHQELATGVAGPAARRRCVATSLLCVTIAAGEHVGCGGAFLATR